MPNCTADKKACSDRKLCIDIESWCDGREDCLDGSDETACPEFLAPNTQISDRAATGTSNVSCAAHNVWCAPDTRCLPLEYRCDGEPDCSDGADEAGCDVQCDQFSCLRSGVCVPSAWRCDGKTDCPHGDDEWNCRPTQRPQCPPGQFGCLGDGRCISTHAVCDGRRNCSDGSDEGVACNDTRVCRVDSCPAGQRCRTSPDTGRWLCLCAVGAAPAPDNAGECRQLDACGVPGWCEHACDQRRGVCTCAGDGLRLSPVDNRSCALDADGAAPPALLFGSGYKVSLLRLGAQEEVTLARSRADTKMDAVAFDHATQTAYWSVDAPGGSAGVMRKRSAAGRAAAAATPFVASGVASIGALAWEWVARALYLADLERLHIAACGGADDGGAAVCAVVVRTLNATPLSLAVYPPQTALFWSQQDGSGRGLIMRAGLDGHQVRPLITENLQMVLGMCVDTAGRRLYWSSSHARAIESARLDGSDRRTVPGLLTQAPYSVVVLGDRLFWSDMRVEEIHACDKRSGKRRQPVIKHPDQLSYHLAGAHASLQPRMRSACVGAACSHLCLLSDSTPAGYRCTCPENMRLLGDESTCRHRRQSSLLLVANERHVVQMAVRVLGARADQEIERVRPQMLTALTVGYLPPLADDDEEDAQSTDVQPETERDLGLPRLLYADSRRQRILRCTGDGRRCRPVAQDRMGLVTAVVVDSARALVYWADSRLGSVQAVRHDGLYRRTVAAGLRYLVHMSAAIEFGVLLVAVGGKSSAIYALKMDGSRRWPLVDGRIDTVSALCYDAGHRHIYWTELRNGVIGRVRLSARPQSDDVSSTAIGDVTAHEFSYFKSNLLNPFSVSVLGDQLYWTSTYSRTLHWANTSDPSRAFQQPLSLCSDSTRQLLLLASGGSQQLPTTKAAAGCRQLACAQLCLAAGADRQVCACSDGFQLTTDQRSCAPINCSTTDAAAPDVDQFACNDGRCISAEWRCNGAVDCVDGEDELGCPEFDPAAAAINCTAGQLPCASRRQCVAAELRCNAVDDCRDGSDEANCSAMVCTAQQFRCGTGACIDAAARCDRYVDCADASDERQCDVASGGASCSQHGMFRCGSGLCVKAEWFCDGHADCADFSDEPADCARSRGDNSTCPAGSRACGGESSLCVDDSLWCDCSRDCRRGQDEAAEQCGDDHLAQCAAIVSGGSGGPPRDLVACDGKQYRCADETCIDKRLVCDGVVQCGAAADDEINCLFIACPGSTKHILAEWLCDGEPDCADGWDESRHECPNNTDDDAASDLPPAAVDASCDAATQQPCANGYQCVERRLLCNGVADCDDRSDEGGRCSAACVTDVCQHQCQQTPAGGVCSCRPGYRLHDDGRSCVDVDECGGGGEWSPCWQRCANTPGGFRCSCAAGFWLEGDGRACRALESPRLIVSAGRRVVSRAVDDTADTATPTEQLKQERVQLLLRRPGVAPARIAVDQHTGRLVFHDRATGGVFVTPADAPTDAPARLVTNTTRLTALAYDWQTKNVYVAEETVLSSSSQGDGGGVGTTVRVCSLLGHCRTVYRRAGESLAALAVLPERGTLFACGQTLGGGGSGRQSNATSGILLSLAADGGGGGGDEAASRRVLLQHKLGVCAGLDLDRTSGRLWWSDYFFNRLMSARLDGSGVLSLQRSEALYRPSSVAVFDHWVYAVERQTAVRRCHTRVDLAVGGSRQRVPLCQLVHVSSTPLQDMTLSHPLRQPTRQNDSTMSACDRLNCAFLCLPAQVDASPNVTDVSVDGALTCRCPDSQPRCRLLRPPPPPAAAAASPAAASKTVPGGRTSRSSAGVTVTLLVLLTAAVLLAVFLWRLQRRRNAAASSSSHSPYSPATRFDARQNGTGRQFQNPVYGVSPPAVRSTCSASAGGVVRPVHTNTVITPRPVISHEGPLNRKRETRESGTVLDNVTVDVPLTDKLVQ